MVAAVAVVLLHRDHHSTSSRAHKRFHLLIDELTIDQQESLSGCVLHELLRSESASTLIHGTRWMRRGLNHRLLDGLSEAFKAKTMLTTGELYEAEAVGVELQADGTLVKFLFEQRAYSIGVIFFSPLSSDRNSRNSSWGLRLYNRFNSGSHYSFFFFIVNVDGS